MEVYAYGKDAKEFKKLCGSIKILHDLDDVSKIQGILYVDSLDTALKIKQKAPWLTVRTWAVEVEGIEWLHLDVYELLHDIEKHGTCRVYVPDDAVRQAVTSILEPVRFGMLQYVNFEKTCRPTYYCSEVAACMKIYETYNTPRWMIPIRFVDTILPSVVNACTTIGTPHAEVGLDYNFDEVGFGYYLDYPPATTPEELAKLLMQKNLKFRKLMPKLRTYGDCRS
jgi:hypothetical protein